MYSAKIGNVHQFTTRHLVALCVILTAVLCPLWAGGASAQADYTCQGEAADTVYIGFESIVTGTNGDDVIYVEGGWNTVDGGLGDDKICVAGHFNTLIGGMGDDELVGDGLYNELFGQDGDDVLITDEESGAFSGGAGDNFCNGSGC